ncbi:hypothetical protein [Nocardia sp. NBC_01329]|uniref:hypothetical protein n=1 Tax=Nocardia sp. NBC_01329 TaxID=2903594 RepID=UPI002E139ECD|nr:hypothetical protein OG405_20055 [Nocardia sp. NBC_01329]
MEADPEVLIPAAKSALGLQGNHEGYLKSMLAVQDELAAYVQSPGAGNQIAQAMNSAHTAGKQLSQLLQEIIETLQDTGIKIDVSDMENAAQLQNANAWGLDGTSSVSGDSISPSTGRVNLTGI